MALTQRTNGQFIPSSYTGEKSATTTVTGQSIAVATGASMLRVRNMGPTNYAQIAFGASASEAETNAASGPIIPVDTLEVFGIPANATFFAYLGNTATVTLDLQQGS